MAKNKFSLKGALEPASPLRKHVCGGIAALSSSDVKLIAEKERPRVGDSLDFDAAAKEEHPEQNRWDYLISIPDRSELVAIEPHTAKDSEVSVVIAKKKRANEDLRSHLQAGHRITRWFWVSHSKVGFSRMDRARRRLDQNGIEFVGRMLRSFA